MNARIIVVHDKGAVHPAEAVAGLAGVAVPIFAANDTDEARRTLPVLRHLGETIALGPEPSENAARLAAVRADGIVTFSEKAIVTTAAVAAELGLPFHTPETAVLLTDKARQRQRLRRAGVDDTRVHVVRSVEDYEHARAALGVPAVLKPAHGGGSRDTYPIDWADPPSDAGQLVGELLRRHAGGGLVLEELLVGRGRPGIGDYVSVETAAVAGRFGHLAITGKFPLVPPFREVGQFWPATLGADEEAAILDLVGAALGALGVRTGIAHTEVKLTGRGPRIIEVNGRLGGHINELASRCGGPNLVGLAGRIALGDTGVPSRIRTRKVVWQYNNPAPMSTMRLTATGDWNALRQISGVTGYKPYYRTGVVPGAGVMTNPLDLVCGEADTHEHMLRQIDLMRDALVYRFVRDGAEDCVTARALPDFGVQAERKLV